MLIGTRQTLALAATLGLVALAGTGVWFSGERMTAALRQNEQSSRLLSEIIEIRFALVNYLTRGEARLAGQVEAGVGRLGARLDTLAAPEVELVERLRGAVGTLAPQFGRLVEVDTRLRAPTGNGASLREQRERLVSQLMAVTQDMAYDALRLSELSDVRIAAAQRGMAATAIGLAVLIALLAFANWALIHRRMLAPLARLGAGTRTIAGGDMSFRLGTGGDDELARLARDFDHMTEQLQSTQAALHRANVTLEQRVEQRTAELAHTVAALHDELAERQRQELRVARLIRLRAVSSAIDAAALRIAERNALYAEVCRIAVEVGEFPIAWLGLADWERLEVQAVAWAGVDDADMEGRRLSLQPDRPAGQSVIARSLQSGKSEVDNDLREIPGAIARDFALRRGLKSVITLPLIRDERPFGALMLYAEPADFFTGEEVRLLEQVAGDICLGAAFGQRAEEIHELAHFDPVTGLVNRTLFMDGLAGQLHRAAAGHRRLALAMLDLTRFKLVNDTLGWQAGDEVLKEFGRRLLGALGAAENCARLGADHFAVVLRDLDAGVDATALVETLLAVCCGTPFSPEGKELRIAGVAGVALFPEDGADEPTLYAHAEVALKQAKLRGRSCLAYSPQLDAHAAGALALEHRLRAAVERGEFVLHYQPKVHTQDRSVSGLEALIRWQSPDEGLVAPNRFIPVLESSGLINEVGRWVIARALADQAAWWAQGLEVPRVAVNVSAVQLRDKDFVGVVADALRGAGDRARLDLEITESLIMDNLDENVALLQGLRDLGVQIAIDDFGTGYSSLRYLARLPLDVLKIDRSFVVAAAHGDGGSRAMVRTIVSLARSLRLKSVAEGVETEEQAEMLRALGCDQLQGFLFHRPMPPWAIEALLPARAAERAAAKA